MKRLTGSRWWPVIRIGALCVGLAAIALALAASWSELQKTGFPSPAVLVAVVALSAASVLSMGRCWLLLLGRPSRGGLVFDGYLRSQLGKYMPLGGGVQASAQMATAVSAGLPTRQVTGAIATFFVVMVAAGSTTAAAVVLSPPDVAPWALLAVAGPVTLILLRPGVLDRAAGAVSRRLTSTPIQVVPPSAEVVRATLWAVVAFIALGGAFAMGLDAFGGETSLPAAIGTYALAWVAGFLLLPVPAGVGVREAVVAAALGLPGGAGPAVAAAVAQRFGAVLAELLLIVGSGIAVRLVQRHRTVTGVET